MGEFWVYLYYTNRAHGQVLSELDTPCRAFSNGGILFYILYLQTYIEKIFFPFLGFRLTTGFSLQMLRCEVLTKV